MKIGTSCTLDWLEIPGGDTAAITAISIAAATNTNRYCGRFFTNIDANAITITICSKKFLTLSSLEIPKGLSSLVPKQ